MRQAAGTFVSKAPQCLLFGTQNDMLFIIYPNISAAFRAERKELTMKIFVTGSGGFVGGRAAAYYGEKHTVWAPGHAQLPLEDGQAVRQALEQFRPQVILHCAAVSDIDETARYPVRSRAANVQAPLHLAQAAAALGAKLVICSSDQVYRMDPQPGQAREAYLQPHRESETNLTPLPLYGQQKLEAERLCLEANPDTVALRLSWMYDALTPAELAEGRRNLATNIMDALSGCSMTLSPTDYRGVTDVLTVVRQLEQAWQLPGGVYNFGSPCSGSMAETVQRAFELAGCDINLIQTGTEGMLSNLAMDQQKLNDAGIVFEDTATHLARWIQAHTR